MFIDFLNNVENFSGIREAPPPNPLRGDPLTSHPLVDL